MATVQATPVSAEQFAEWVSRPENQDRFFELEQGRIVEMPPPGELHGILCGWIAHLLWEYVLRRGKGGVSSNDTGLLVGQNPDTVRGPDLMLFEESRELDKLSRRFVQRLPKLVVEVLSPSDPKGKVDLRVSQYLRRGVPLVWVVDPEVRTVTAHRPGKDLYVRDDTEELTGEEPLPDLRLRVADLFTLPGAAP